MHTQPKKEIHFAIEEVKNLYKQKILTKAETVLIAKALKKEELSVDVFHNEFMETLERIQKKQFKND